DAIPTVVPSNEPPLNALNASQRETTGQLKLYLKLAMVTYMISWALSCRIRGSRSLERHWRKLWSVSVGFFSMWILSVSLQISRPVRATRTFNGL
uniref:Uncharacterized protein n=1 Tax=Periophthalmus magnuspinnatus TaxID=409849 RepID=A0A3B3Z965_9GOBI